MRALIIATALSLAVWVSVHAQTRAAGQARAGQTAPAQTPPAQTTPTPRPPFPEGTAFAYVNIQRVASESSQGKEANAQVQALREKKVSELNEMNKALQDSQQKLQQSATILSDAARLQLERDIEKRQLEIQRATQDADAEVQELTQNLQLEFQQKLLPVIELVAVERKLQLIFSAGDAGLVWANAALDLTEDVIKRLDAASGTAGAAAAPAPPPGPPPGR